MAMHEHEQAERLEAYWAALERDPAATPPAGLDVDLAQTAQRLVNGLRPPEPGPAFVSQLRRQLQAQTAELPCPGDPAPTHRSGWWQRLGQLVHSPGPVRLAVATLVVAALVAASFAIRRPQPVSAQAIIQKAQAAATSPAVGGVQSFVLTKVCRFRLANGRLDPGGSDSESEEIVSVTRRWYRAPDRLRSEHEQRALLPDGTEVPRSSWLHINDGRDVWLYYPNENRVTVNRPSPDQMLKGDTSALDMGAGDLNALLQEVSTCYNNPKITGNATVAGRSTYVIDLGPSLCPVGPRDMSGRRVIWVDEETFFILKQEQYSKAGDRLIWQSEVTSLQYNVAVADAVFTFTPPAGASMLDERHQALPTPVPGSSLPPGSTADPQQAALLAALEPLAREVDYPLFVPEHIPAGLAPRLPKLQPQGEGKKEAWIEYVSAGEVEQDTMPTLRIIERLATYESVITGTNRAIPIAVDVGKAWARLGFRDVSGNSRPAEVLVLRDGTLLRISSYALTAEDLLEIASSLQAVPGSHAPLPEPQPSTLAELRARAPYPIFVPTWVPEGLRSDPPWDGGSEYDIGYYDADGRQVLNVSNGAEWLPNDPSQAGEPVVLPNGLSAYWLMPGQILWWIQEGTKIAIWGADLTQDEMVKIAVSMSKTADLGSIGSRPQPTPAPVLPTPTPMPTPTFKVLRPTWLPEPMTVREQVDLDFHVVTLGFDPQPDGSMPRF